jgi:hypothetical protein
MASVGVEVSGDQTAGDEGVAAPEGDSRPVSPARVGVAVGLAIATSFDLWFAGTMTPGVRIAIARMTRTAAREAPVRIRRRGLPRA